MNFVESLPEQFHKLTDKIFFFRCRAKDLENNDKGNKELEAEDDMQEGVIVTTEKEIAAAIAAAAALPRVYL